jgi:small subunit ribosomal protein S21
LKVVVRNGNLEQAMRVLKKKLQKDGRLRELKERQYYIKPSEDKREAKKRGIVNTKKRMKKLALQRGF